MSEPVSVDCAQVDINALCDKMRVAAFDLDGTLARSKKPMHPDMAQALSTLTTLMPVAIISGGAMPLLESQVTDVLTDDADRTHLHLMPTTGTRYFRWSGGEWTPIYQRDLRFPPGSAFPFVVGGALGPAFRHPVILLLSNDLELRDDFRPGFAAAQDANIHDIPQDILNGGIVEMLPSPLIFNAVGDELRGNAPSPIAKPIR